MSRARCVVVPAVLVVLATTLSACTDPGAGPDDPAGPSSAEEQLSGMPGMSAASIGRQVVDEDVEVTQVVVDAEAGASAQQIADVVGEVLDHEEDYAVGQDAPVTGVVYLDAGTTDWIDPDFPGKDPTVPSGLWWGADQGAPEVDGRPVADLAGWLVDAAALVPDAVVVVDHDDDLKVRLPDFDPAAVGEVATVLLGTDSLRGVPTIVSAGDQVREVDHEPVAVLAGNPMTPDLVAAWARFVAGPGRAPDVDVRELSLGPLVTGELDQTLGAGEVNAVTTVRLPGVVPPRRLTPEEYGDLLWPLLDPQLAVVAGLGAEASLTAVNTVRSTADGDVDDVDVFLTVQPGRAPEPDALGRSWNTEAAARPERR